MIKSCLGCQGYSVATGKCINNEQFSEPTAIQYPANFQCDHFRHEKFTGLCNSCRFYKKQCCIRFGIFNIIPEEFGCVKYKERREPKKRNIPDKYKDTCIACKYMWEKGGSCNYCNYWKCSLPEPGEMQCIHYTEVE